MSGFNLQISGAGSDHFAICATNTASHNIKASTIPLNVSLDLILPIIHRSAIGQMVNTASTRQTYVRLPGAFHSPAVENPPGFFAESIFWVLVDESKNFALSIVQTEAVFHWKNETVTSCFIVKIQNANKFSSIEN